MFRKPARVTRHAHVIVKHQLTLGIAEGPQTHGLNVRVDHEDGKQYSVFSAAEDTHLAVLNIESVYEELQSGRSERVSNR
jgi:hypothetical protein